VDHPVLVDADEFPVLDSVSTPVAFALRRLSWASLKAALLAWFGPVTVSMSNKTLVAPTITSPAIQNGHGGPIIAVGVGSASPTPNYIQFNNTDAGTSPVLFTFGPDAKIDLNLILKGGGKLICSDIRTSRIYDWGGSSLTLELEGSAAAVNHLRVSSALTTQPPAFQAIGTDVDIDLLLKPKGSGVVRVGNNPVGVKVPVPASATAAGKPGQWAADATHIYAYTGNGTVHTWVRSAAAAW
jgi:hypothetical protein